MFRLIRPCQLDDYVKYINEVWKPISLKIVVLKIS